MLETDAPWMPTAQRRLSGNTAAEPADLVEVLRHAALLRGLSLEDAARQARVNTAELFPRLVETAFAAPPASQD